MIKIGVFDSGMGGLSVANAIKKSIPEAEVLFINDAEHVPYGSKTPEQLFGFVMPILETMVDRGCHAIVIACNSVTTTIVTDLRSNISIPLIGMEPMIKPAASHTQSGVIAVCATPLTLSSQRYNYLKHTYAQSIKVIEPDCSEWAFMIENNQIDREKIISDVQLLRASDVDTIVLGCTHYHWIEELIKYAAGPEITVLQPEVPVIAQLQRVLHTIKT
jgi:glutamate racemase